MSSPDAAAPALDPVERREPRDAASPDRVARWLSFAPAPTFALMAALTVARNEGPVGLLCSAALHRSPLDGMVVMYGLMSIFHSAPWMALLFRSRP